MSLLHIRNKDLQTAVFTTGAELTQESGAAMHEEDGTTVLELDGSISWTVQILHAPQLPTKVIMSAPEISEQIVYADFTLLNEDSEEILNEAGENIVTETADMWPTSLVHARRL